MTKQSHFMKKTVAMLLGVIMLLGMTVSGFAYDVSSDLLGTKYEDAGAVLGALGIMVGDPDGNFRPDDGIKRSWAIATILMDKLDDLMVDDPKYVEEIGNIKFEFKENQATNLKLAPNSSMAMLTVPLTVTVIGIRGGRE